MFNPKQVTIAVVAIACALSGPVRAEDTTASELTRLSESIAVLTARQKELELKAQIAQKQQELARAAGAGPELPSFVDIEGIDGKLVARLVFSRGIEQAVKKGETIRGGFNVSQITVNEIVLTRGKERFHIPFSTQYPGQAGQSGSNGPSSIAGAQPPSIFPAGR